jgi:hypothetical protein
VPLHAQERCITVSLPILSLARHGLASEARSTAPPYVDAHGQLPDPPAHFDRNERHFTYGTGH